MSSAVLDPIMFGAAVFIVVAVLVAVTRKRPQSTHLVGLPADLRRRYSRHIRQRMVERGVSRDEVEATLATPDRMEHDLAQASMRFEKDFHERILKVWVVREPHAAWPPTAEVVLKTTAWVHTTRFEVPSECVGRLIGRQGATIRSIRESTGARVWIDDNVVHLSADNRRPFEQAKHRIHELIRSA
ncbi:KH domain-containing protein [Nocardioides daphniae]|uniref:DUF4258 domain-containing protein n=1 Tax=Nocardioides daphniae TaxID=402297 RepID=A0A4P7UEL8_9ACTN|nr:KH domain-containing protein [Nocardioides daphniae]QCC77389.1 DUF4258 domain-containing protein [Nocardioides daphniae]GGD24657.1 hypothetical protein GCM10007231_24820 [Nocardioides daphniae]